MSDLQTNTLLMVIIAILIPPLAVFLKKGLGMALIISIILTLLFYVPGLIHALYVILKT
ncbi:MAG: YqaE/Pmp3 family membrane protein [Phycisphaeraceae bacterium]|nr:YqaE/Pmp3 family membrane protein [Phycisphaeraceae bacterium]MCW5767930.1 YqaE/Pmp3 family membrane protein [Phycisphaeraceae bacterium]